MSFLFFLCFLIIIVSYKNRFCYLIRINLVFFHVNLPPKELKENSSPFSSSSHLIFTIIITIHVWFHLACETVMSIYLIEIFNLSLNERVHACDSSVTSVNKFREASMNIWKNQKFSKFYISRRSITTMDNCISKMK